MSPDTRVPWWVVVEGKERGPLTEGEMREGIRDGSIPRDAECWREGLDGWQSIVETEEWAGAFPPQPKPMVAPRPVPPPFRKSSIILSDFLVPVPDAEYAPLVGLNSGSKGAQKRQREWVEKGYPLEVKMKKTGMLFRLVPPGEFMMGLDDDEGEYYFRHRVNITRPTYVGKYPVTQREWEGVMLRNPSEFKTGLVLKERVVKYNLMSWINGTVLQEEIRLEADEHPVDSVSWNDIQEFLNRLHEEFELAFSSTFRLPTEAEWEYACRAGTEQPLYGELDAIAWYYLNSRISTPLHPSQRVPEKDRSWLYWCAVGAENSCPITHPVGEKLPNAWGLYDMIGNVCEWCADCADWHGDYYQKSPQDDPPGLETGTHRVFRGGSFNTCGGDNTLLSAYYRETSPPDIAFNYNGFRVAVPVGVD